MTDEYMTLKDALLTGLPIKHKDWHYTSAPGKASCEAEEEFFFAPVWQVQRPKPKKKRIWQNSGLKIWIGESPPPNWTIYQDITDILKEILKDEE
jgi:hypothetical protein